MRTRTFLLMAGLLALVSTALASSAAPDSLHSQTIGPNGQSAISPRYALAEEIGQPMIGRTASATYTACYGFLCGTLAPVIHTLYLPVVFQDYDPNVDRYDLDETFQQAKPIATDGSVQLHNFYPAGDVDWVWFTASPGTYDIATSVRNNVYPDTVMTLYAANGITPLARNDDCNGYTRASCLTYTSSVSTTLYLEVSPYDASSIGPDSWYGLTVVKQ